MIVWVERDISGNAQQMSIKQAEELVVILYDQLGKDGAEKLLQYFFTQTAFIQIAGRQYSFKLEPKGDVDMEANAIFEELQARTNGNPVPKVPIVLTIDLTKINEWLGLSAGKMLNIMLQGDQFPEGLSLVKPMSDFLLSDREWVDEYK